MSTELQNALQKLEKENRDLRFLAGEYQRQIEVLEAESRRKSDRILQLQEKNLQAVISTPGQEFLVCLPVSPMSLFFCLFFILWFFVFLRGMFSLVFVALFVCLVVSRIKTEVIGRL